MFGDLVGRAFRRVEHTVRYGADADADGERAGLGGSVEAVSGVAQPVRSQATG